MDLVNHGFGVIEFQNVIEIKDDLIYSLINLLEKQNESNFSFYVENGIEYAKNKSGFVFSADEIKSAPSRYTDLSFSRLGEKERNKYSSFIKEMDEGIYRCLVEYCKLYPDASTTVWWKTDGHIASYSEGQHIGPHSDNQMPYPDQFGNFNSIPIHNTISCALFLNSHSDIGIQDKNNFTGGEIYFSHPDVSCKSKAGNVIMYPSNYIGRHEVKPVTSGNRHVYLQFFSYGKNENLDKNSIKWLNSLQKDVNSGHTNAL